jgi:hypothetical protein
MGWLTIVGSVVGGALGGSAAVFGLSRFLGDLWLEKQKARYSKELEEFRDSLHQQQARMQAEIDRSVFVTRAHFETEFLAMKEVSQCLAEIKIVYRLLNPSDASKRVPSQEHVQNVARLSAANDAFLERLEAWAAFLEPDLYDEFDHCHIGANEELKRLKANREDDSREKAQNAEYFWRAYRNACQKVRDRIKSLAVLPGT